MLDVCELFFDYQDKPLLSNVQFSVKPGQLLHLRGNNGSGKTTLLKILSGLLFPQKGDIRYQGKPIYYNLPDYQEKLCYVGHRPGVNSSLTIRENCLFDTRWGMETDLFMHLCGQFALANLLDQPCYKLSAGQRRRVALLRLSMARVKIWLLDEPFVALDQEATGLLIQCIGQHLAEDGLIVLTSHQSFQINQISYLEYLL